MGIIAAQESLFPEMELKQKEWAKLSGSHSGHCRMEIWLAANGWPREDREGASMRTMNLGTLAELAMFDKVIVFDPVANAADSIGPWWPEMGVLKDPVSGESIDCQKSEIVLRQAEVDIDGVMGHLDGVALVPHLKFKTNLPELEAEVKIEPVVLDAKTMPGLTWKRNYDGDLLENPFSREYVFQLQFYLEGLRRKGGVVVQGKNYGVPKRAALVCFNKENSKVILRFVHYDESLVAEMHERLSWGRSESEPKPDWPWQKGKPVPLRCQYCDYRQSCAGVRGATVVEAEKGAKGWVCSSLTTEGKDEQGQDGEGHQDARKADALPPEED